MRRTQLISVLVVVAVVALALGSYSAVTGTGPVGSAIDAVFGDDDDADEDEKQEVVGDVIECPSGKDVRSKFKQNDGKFKVEGLLVRLTATEAQVTGPDGVPGGNPVTAAVDEDTEVKGDPQADEPVKVEGSVLGDGSFAVGQIKPACGDPDDADSDGNDEGAG